MCCSINKVFAPRLTAACGKLLPLCTVTLIPLVLWNLPAGAQLLLPQHSTEPITLEADQAEASHPDRRVTYNGNVVITQGSQRLTGDTMTISYTANNTIEHARIIGAPAVWQQQHDADNLRHGEALQIDYFVSTARIVFQGDAVIHTNQGTLSSEHIEYNTASGSVTALSREEANDRVRMIFKSAKDSQALP